MGRVRPGVSVVRGAERRSPRPRLRRRVRTDGSHQTGARSVQAVVSGGARGVQVMVSGGARGVQAGAHSVQAVVSGCRDAMPRNVVPCQTAGKRASTHWR